MKKNYTKILAVALAVVTLLSAVTIGTLAYLMKKTDSIVNTFTIGDITLTLTEEGATGNAQTFNVLPGDTVTKKATVTVTSASDDCWLFIKVDTENLDKVTDDSAVGANWDMADGWTATSTDGVFYRKITKGSDGESFSVLKDDQLVVSTMGLTDNCKMTFTAYAIQASNLPSADADEEITKADAAWDIVKDAA